MDTSNGSNRKLVSKCWKMFNDQSVMHDFSSFFFILGPSYNIDSACSSGALAMTHAFDAVRRGKIEGAIVAGSNLILSPAVSVQFNKLKMLSPDGKCKVFDESCKFVH